jgi:predicted Fe-Mo cluster-binding NifX family protein
MCRLATLVALIGLGFIMAADAEQGPTRLAVAADGKTLDSAVGGKGARCRYFIFFDAKGELEKAIANPHRDASRSAGPACAGLLEEHDVTVFVAGDVGRKMARALKSKKIRHVVFEGSVQDAVEHVLGNQP